IIEVIVSAGFEGEDVHHLHHQLVNALWGALIIARFVPYQTSDGDEKLQFFSDYVEYFAHCNNTTEFEFGLDLILDAFEARLDSTSISTARRSRRPAGASTASKGKRATSR